MLQSTGSQSQTRLSDWTVTARNFIYFKCDSIKAFKSDLMCLYSISHILCMLSCFSHVRLFVTLWTVACQTPLSVGFSMQEYWSGLPCPPPGDLSNPRIEPAAPSLPLSHRGSPSLTLLYTNFIGQSVYIVLPVCSQGLGFEELSSW